MKNKQTRMIKSLEILLELRCFGPKPCPQVNVVFIVLRTGESTVPGEISLVENPVSHEGNVFCAEEDELILNCACLLVYQSVISRKTRGIKVPL